MSDRIKLVRKICKPVEVAKSEADIVFDTSERNSFKKEPDVWASHQVKIPEIDAYWCIYLRTCSTDYKKAWTCEFFTNNEEIIKSGLYIVAFKKLGKYTEFDKSYFNAVEVTQNINSNHIIGITSEPFSRRSKYEFQIDVTVIFRGEIYDPKFTKLATTSPRNWILETQKLLDSSELSDFTYKVKDKEFKVHKVILSLASPVFKNTFICGLDETKSNIAVIHDCEPEMFEHLLTFIYKGILPENLQEIVLDLYELAHLYQIQLLQELCVGHIMSVEIDEQNAVQLYGFAKKFDLKELHSNCWTFIKIQMLRIYTPLDDDTISVQELQQILEVQVEAREKLKQFRVKERVASAEKAKTESETRIN